MGRNRNMDELIKRELDGLEIQPTNLTFNKVQKAYYERKSGVQVSRSKMQWPLVAVLIIALFAFLYVLVMPESDVASTSNSTPSPERSETSESTSHNAGIVAGNRENSESGSLATERVSPSLEKSAAPEEPNIEESPVKANDQRASVNNKTNNNIIKKVSEAKGDASANAQPIAAEQKVVAAVNSAIVREAGNGKKVNATNGVAANSNDNLLPTVSGNPNKKRKGKTGKGGSKTEWKGIAQEANGIVAKTNNDNLNGHTASDRNTISGSAAQSEKTTTPEVLNASLENSSEQQYLKWASYLLPVPVPYLSSAFKMAEPEVLNIAYNDSLARTDRYKDYYRKRLRPYYFTISSEMQLNHIEQNIAANNDLLLSVDLPQFKGKTYNAVLAESISASTQMNLGGSFLLGFHYYDFGIETGIRFFGFENTTYLKHIHNSYYNKIMSGITYDTLSNTYDTLYNITSYHYPFKVNGDSVSPAKYLSTYRFASIPLRLTYAFHALRSKLVIEPSLGVQFCLPLASNNIVYERPYEFSYEKSTKKLSPFMQYDGALKLQYQLSRSAGIYVRQGYSFGSQSLYAAAYPVKLSVNSLYTSIGINITLRK